MVDAGSISPEEAIAHADNRTDVSLRLRLAAGNSFEIAGMRMTEPVREPEPITRY